MKRKTPSSRVEEEAVIGFWRRRRKKIEALYAIRNMKISEAQLYIFFSEKYNFRSNEISGGEGKIVDFKGESDSKVAANCCWRCTWKNSLSSIHFMCIKSSQITCLLWNPKVHYRVHNSPPLVCMLSQMNTVHTFPLHCSKIHLNVIFPSMPTSSEWHLPFRSSD